MEGKMAKLTLGTARITETANGAFILNWMNHGSFLVGEQIFGNINPALRFCRERDLRVIECK
jgi:hypothetical protein